MHTGVKDCCDIYKYFMDKINIHIVFHHVLGDVNSRGYFHYKKPDDQVIKYFPAGLYVAYVTVRLSFYTSMAICFRRYTENV